MRVLIAGLAVLALCGAVGGQQAKPHKLVRVVHACVFFYDDNSVDYEPCDYEQPQPAAKQEKAQPASLTDLSKLWTRRAKVWISDTFPSISDRIAVAIVLFCIAIIVSVPVLEEFQRRRL